MPNSLPLLFILAVSAIFILLFLLPFSVFLMNTRYFLTPNVFTQLNSDEWLSAKIWGHSGGIHIDIGLESQMDICT